MSKFERVDLLNSCMKDLRIIDDLFITKQTISYKYLWFIWFGPLKLHIDLVRN